MDHQRVMGFPQPAGLHQYWKSEFLPQLPDGFLDAYRRHAQAITSPISQLILFQLGGAVGDREAGATAMGNRDARYIFLAAGTWSPDDPDSHKHLGWVRSTWQALEPYSSGGNYVNAHNGDEEEERTQAAYRDGYARLRQVKRRYDPDNVFCSNRNIPPAV